MIPCLPYCRSIKMEVLFYFGIESKLVSRECLFSGLEGSDPGQLFVRRESYAGGEPEKVSPPKLGAKVHACSASRPRARLAAPQRSHHQDGAPAELAQQEEGAEEEPGRPATGSSPRTGAALEEHLPENGEARRGDEGHHCRAEGAQDALEDLSPLVAVVDAGQGERR